MAYYSDELDEEFHINEFDPDFHDYDNDDIEDDGYPYGDDEDDYEDD